MDKLEFAENAAPNDQPGDDSPVQLLDATILRGFNVYHRDTVIRQTVDIGSLHGMRSGQFGPNFGARFADCFRALRQKVPGDDFSEDFLARLNDPDGVSFEEALLEAIIAIETSFAFERGDLEAIAFRTIESGEAHRQVALIWSSAVMRHSRVAAEIGLGSLVALLPDDLRAAYTTDTDALESTFEAARKEARRRRPPANTAALILAAKQRGIPCESLGGSRLRLGEGSSQHHIFSSAMSKTALWTNRLSDDKRYMRRRLSELGLPVVRQLKVATIEAARQATQRLGGYRVLVRPLDQRTGKGKAPVTTSIDDIDKAFDAVAEPGTGAVVESLPDGNSYNLLVVGGQVIATARLMPPIIEGDGKRTIEQLVHDLNDDSFRDGFRMRKVTVDERLAVYLSGLGNELDDVLAAGEVVALRPHATIATGGVAVDVSDQVHP
ncbi:MAG: hypothetical protein ACR2Q4_03445, partial [Geminicoccaceae bacterium]